MMLYKELILWILTTPPHLTTAVTGLEPVSFLYKASFPTAVESTKTNILHSPGTPMALYPGLSLNYLRKLRNGGG